MESTAQELERDRARGSEIVGALVHLHYMNAHLERFPKQFLADQVGVHRTTMHKLLGTARASIALAQEFESRLKDYEPVKRGRPKGTTGTKYKPNRKRRVRSGFPRQ